MGESMDGQQKGLAPSGYFASTAEAAGAGSESDAEFNTDETEAVMTLHMH